MALSYTDWKKQNPTGTIQEYQKGVPPAIPKPTTTSTTKPNFSIAYSQALKSNPNLTTKEFEKTFNAQAPGNAAYLEQQKAKVKTLTQTNQQNAQDQYIKSGGTIKKGEVYDPYATLRDMADQRAAGVVDPTGKATYSVEEANQLRQSATGKTISYNPSTKDFLGTKTGFTFAQPTAPGEGATEGATKAYEKAMKIYKENQGLANELQKTLKQKKGLEANFTSEIAKLKQQNANFAASLDGELGFPGADDMISSLENGLGIVIDKTDENLKLQLKNLLDQKNNGVIDEGEFQQAFNNTLLKAGQSVASLMSPEDLATYDEEPQIGEGIAATSEEVFGPGLQSPEELPYVEPVTNHPSGAVTDNISGVTTYQDPKSLLNFQSVPNQNALDLTKLSVEDIEKLDGITLLKAETKMFMDLADEDSKNQDAFFDKLSSQILQQQESTKATILSYSKLKEDNVKLEQMKALDDIEYQKNQLAMEKASAFDEIAEAEAKTEGYMKGKLSAFGGGKSSAALAIMSANKLKFAKVMSNAEGKFSAEGTRLQQMATYTQLAFTNSIVEIQMDANKSIVELTTNTQNQLMNVMGQKLQSDSEKRREKATASLNYIKGIKDIKSAQEQAKAQAEADAKDFFFKGLDMADKLSDTRGTIWEFTPDGQLIDTGKPTLKATTDLGKLELDKEGLNLQKGHLGIAEANLGINQEKLTLQKEKQAFDMQLAMQKLAMAAAKGSGGGGGGGGGGGSSSVDGGTLVAQLRNSIDPTTGALYTDEAIANALPTLYGSAAKGLANIQSALNELNTTPNTATGEGANPFYVPKKTKELSPTDQYFSNIMGGGTSGGSGLTAGLGGGSKPTNIPKVSSSSSGSKGKIRKRR